MWYAKIYATGNCITHEETRVKISGVVIFPLARNVPVIAIWSPRNPKNGAIVWRSAAHPSITCWSSGIKKDISIEAVKYTKTPIPVKRRKEIHELTRAISEARFIFLAPIFCQTSVEVAIESAIAGIIISWTIFDPAPYEAIAIVPKLVIRNVITTILSERVDISTEEGKPSRNARLI